MLDPANVTSTIRAEMARRGVKQRDVAHALGISVAGVSDRLRGVTALRVDELVVVAGLLGVSAASLLGTPVLDQPQADEPSAVSA